MRHRSEQFFGNLQVSFFAEVVPQGQRQLAAKYTRQGEGPTDKGWRIIPFHVVSKVCTDLDNTLFEMVLN